LALAQVTFGRGRLRCSTADMTKKTSQGGAPEEKEGDGREEEARGSLAAVNLARGACRHRGVRRRIASACGGLHVREERRGKRGSRAFYRRARRGEGVRVWRPRARSDSVGDYRGEEGVQRRKGELTGGLGRSEGEGVLTGRARLSAGRGKGAYPFGF
jgi:hypothetical protein